MTDRELCKRCVHSYFETDRKFMWCNHLDDTGRKRPHDGDSCYGFELWDGKKKRRRALPPAPRRRHRKAVTAEAPTAAVTEEAVKRKVRKAARRVVHDSRHQLEMAIMCVQHMGDGFNRVYL